MSASSEDRKKILDRILKILALANGTSFDGEAANARRMAEELIAKHNVNLSAEGKTPRAEIVDYNYVPWGKKWLWERIIATSVAALCGCYILFYGDPDKGEGYSRFRFIGPLSDVEAASYILDEIHRQRSKAWVRYKAEGGADTFGKFCFSFARGLEAKIERLVTPATLTQVDKIKVWYEKSHTVNRASAILGQGSSSAGREAGSGASLHRGTTSGSARVPRIGK